MNHRLQDVSCDKTMVKGRATYEADGEVSIEIWDDLCISELFCSFYLFNPEKPSKLVN